MRSFTIKRLAAATFVGGALTLAPIALPAANAAPPVDCRDYQGFVTTQTSVSLSPSSPDRGDLFTATATVTMTDEEGSAPATGGTVTFKYAGATKTDPVVAGEASVNFTARSNGAVVATYSGVCPGGGATVLGSSRDRATIAGVEASAGGGGGVGGVAGGSGGIGGLASTGLDTQTQLFGLLGVGMVTVGGLSLMVHRRRTQS
jgi:LPXTG-motif cell wall-anchored protein